MTSTAAGSSWDQRDMAPARRPAETDSRAQTRVVERELHLARERYERLFHMAPDAYVVTDLRGIIQEANEPAVELLGLLSTRGGGKAIALCVPPSDRNAVKELIRAVKEHARLADRPMRVRGAGGHDVQISASLSVFPASGAPPTEILWLLRDVTLRVEREASLARMAIELELRVAARTQELEDANRAKDEFLSLVSHELRTPITVIMGGSEFLQRHVELVTEEATPLIDDVHREAIRLSRIIDDLLTLARADRGEGVEMEPIRIRRIVASVVGDHHKRFPDREIVVDDAEFDQIACGSNVYVEQIVRNLLSNAEKYSPHGEQIEITMGARNGEVTVDVTDHGKGLPEEEMDALFEPFYRSPGTAHLQGIGIGLTVCKRLAERQGGRVWARGADGGGMDFGFAIPNWTEPSEGQESE